MLEAMEQAYTNNGMHKLAMQIGAERKKVLSNVQEDTIETENRGREFTAAGTITSEEAKNICDADFDAKTCATLNEAIDSTATRAYFAKHPYELRNTAIH